MLDPKHFVVVAGQDLVEELRVARQAVPQSPFGYASGHLVKLQEMESRRGIRGAEIVESNYGFSVRAASGLQNFALLASSRAKQVDGSLEDAVRWAKAWVAQDPTKRYAYHRTNPLRSGG